MRKERRYKITITVLAAVILLQWLLIIALLKPKRPPPVYIKPKGRIAVVIDDWGYNLNNLHIVDQIKYPLTCSVLPRLKYSATVSSELHARGFEIILHLPLQPREKYNLEKDTIMVSSTPQAIEDIMERDLNSIAYAKGVSNHMGSLATENQYTMSAIFKELKKRRLYFLDSLVSPKSLCERLSKKMGLSFARRDIFLDNKEEPAYIRNQIMKLKTKAKVYGQAIGIGHDRRVTLEVLKEMMPQLEKEGYSFVFVSELAR